MDRRLELQDELEKLLGTENVYFQPPESLKLNYPCYVYNRNSNDNAHADNYVYRRIPEYDLVYITYDPDDPLVDETEGHFRMIHFDRFYTIDNLNHYHFVLYY